MDTQRFTRQLMTGFGPGEQERLNGATVLVAGVGGVGGAAATYLAAAGIGRLVLVHPGPLEKADLNRQTLMRPDRIGESRVLIAADTLRTHHSEIAVETWDRDLFDPLLPDLVAAADAVIDARHNFPERFQINRMCLDAGVPLVVAAMNATEIQLLTVDGSGPCLRCVFAAGDPDWDPLGFPVFGAVAGTVGCLAAMEVIKLISGFAEPSVGRLLVADLWDLDFRSLPVARDPACADCGLRQPTVRAPRQDGASGR
ncbi:ThiF family adenylyltransferase [Frankia sp. QA3]|uniref:HesA/MoeB/ThiF family protein n=1 Tax=Frankia sp. QA3 TaxID=710111 RepID=UPI000269CB99|nr:ThiF family adenylyltransferase [Frankia sp. QA3]EIV95458.1 dinucleotide-utilizing enzyme possibly involved in molybdopterin or thiamin biosynthesis [Frankia sp. QA3]